MKSKATSKAVASYWGKRLSAWKKGKFTESDEEDVTETLKTSDAKGTIPSWVLMARKLLKSKSKNEKLKAYWRKRLEAWEAKNKGK